jgi:hypothetical protein
MDAGFRNETWRRLSNIALPVALGLAVIAGIVILRTFDPNAPGNFFPKCIFKAFTGFDCIGCGLTRALHALAHGDLVRAFDFNPLAMLALPLMPLMVLEARGQLPKALHPLMVRVMRPKLWIVLLPAYWIARNLPWWPFSWMAAG